MIDLLGSHQAWALPSAYLSALSEIERLYRSGVAMRSWEIRALLGLPEHPTRTRVRPSAKTAIVPVRGLLTPHVEVFGQRTPGGATIARDAFRAAMRDDRVRSIVLDVDSSGGATTAIEELHDEIFQARAQKRIVASVNSLAASAAFWIASAAHEIVLTPSGHVGSIGVLGVHMDMSERAAMQGVRVSVVSAGKFEAEASEFTPLSPSARSHLQMLVDDRFDVMVKQIARGRGTSERTVREGFGQGRLVHARRALALKMVDRMEPQDKTIARLSGVRDRPSIPSPLQATINAEFELAFLAQKGERINARIREREQHANAYDPLHVFFELAELAR